MDYIAYLRETRQFATILRNGLRLMWSLGQGDLTVLFELFPTLRAQFAPDNIALLEEFRALLKEQPVMAVATPITLDASGGIKQLAAPKIEMPTFNDEEDIVVVRQDTRAGADTTANFLDAAFSFQKKKD